MGIDLCPSLSRAYVYNDFYNENKEQIVASVTGEYLDLVGRDILLGFGFVEILLLPCWWDQQHHVEIKSLA